MTLYEEYEDLVIEKDYYEKLEAQYNISYIKEFGDIIEQIVEKKFSCIEKKKTITYFQMMLNKGERVKDLDLQKYLDGEMKSFRETLAAVRQSVKTCKEATPVSEYEANKCKAIYRRLAKQIHPDINAELYEDDDTFEDLWEEIVNAYKGSRLSKLVELEVRVNKELRDRNIEVKEPVIEDIELKIEFLKEEINEIKTNEPYLYKLLLEDAEAMAEKHKGLEKELKEYTDYEEELKKILRTYLTNGVEIEWNQDL